MHPRRSPLEILAKRASWLTVPLLLATFVTLRVKTDDKISLQSVPLKETKVLGRAIDFIEKNYVDPQAADASKMIRSASKELVRSIPPLLVKERPKALEVSMGDKKATLPLANPLSLDHVPQVLSRLLGFLGMFYDGKLDDQERLTLAMTGVAETLDPHTNYLSPKVYSEFKIGTKGNFGGLGIVIGIREGDLTVIAPLEGTPAYTAGIQAKDKIVQIGEESTINMGLTEAVEKLRGPIGSRVSLVITRTGQMAPLKFALTRALIHIQSVAGRLLEGKKIGLIRIKNFQEDTMEQFRKILRSFEREGGPLEGLVLDLRNNPGGLLDQAVAMSDYFLSSGVIVKTVGAHGEPLDIEKASPGDEGEGMPLVAIVNEGSASASEIVAGALQFNDRAAVIGNRSFGKGSVQTVYDLKDGSALKLTIAKYLTAKDQEVQSIGINPDVGLIPATIEEIKPEIRKDEKEKSPNAPKQYRVNLFDDVKKRELDLLEEDEDDEPHKEANLPPPPFLITYLGMSDSEDDENSAKIKLEGDFPVEFAAKLLENPGKALHRPDVLDSLPSLLDEAKKGEEEKIKAMLAKYNVDWSAGPKEGKPVGLVTVEILDDQENPKKSFSPGESGYLRVTVENRGNAPFYKLAAVTKSEDPLFANLEFPLGRIDPQGQHVWKAPLKIPDFVHRRSIPVEFTFHEAYDRLPKSPVVLLEVSEPQAPRFEYSYNLVDNGTQGTKGNGNRRVEKGETIGLALKIRNIGRGESRAPIVNLKRDKGEEVFIEKGREELKPLAAGEQTETTLKFRVPSELASHEAKHKVSLTLNIHDNHLGEDLGDQLEFPLENGEEAAPPPGTAQSPPNIETSPELPPLAENGDSYTLKGTASGVRELKHVFVFVGNEKVFYQAPDPAKDKKSLAFETKLPLKKGANLITLAAQDDRELTSRKQWIVWRDK